MIQGDSEISVEALTAAAEAMEAVDGGRVNLYHASWRVLARASLGAFLDAEGFEVEHHENPTPSAGAELPPSTRLVSPWRPK